MTFQEFSIKYLTDRGMFDNQAVQVVEGVKSYQPSMVSLWNQSIDGYPDAVKTGLVLSLRSSAVEWIDNNLPQAWFRSMFV
jgi:hypothetical protein